MDGGVLVRLVSERDLRSVATQLNEAMTEQVFVVSGTIPIDEVAQQMCEHKYGSAVVVGNDGV